MPHYNILLKNNSSIEITRIKFFEKIRHILTVMFDILKYLNKKTD